jgi:5-methylcytosine-specific restriction endonuclease McrA
MHNFLLTHLQDAVLLHDLKLVVADERAKTAIVLAHIAEVDARKLYAPEGYASMFDFCLRELHFSEDSAYKRIQAARAARALPALFVALADNRVHLAAIRLLAPHLTDANADELIAAATHKSKRDLELWLAGRFPQAGQMRLDDGISAVPVSVVPTSGSNPELSTSQLAPGQVVEPARKARVAALSPDWHRIDALVPTRVRDKIRYALELDGHGDFARLLEESLDDHIEKREKRKFAATRKPRAAQARTSTRPRHIPARVKRGVWERDQGRCTFVAATGKACDARTFLVFDHVDPVARGGKATVEGMRLRCRAHNQLEAERTFGAEFMKRKRTEEARTNDVVSALRNLGLSARDARLAAEGTPAEGTLEDQLRAALQSLRPRRNAPGTPVEHGSRAGQSIPAGELVPV